MTTQLYPPASPPEPKRSWFARHRILAGLLFGVGAWLLLMIVIAVVTGSSNSPPTPTKAAKPAVSTPAATPTVTTPAPKYTSLRGSDLAQFKVFVNENGTAAEQATLAHITKVQYDNSSSYAEIFTDYTGGMFGPHQGAGRLLASAFTSWQTTDSGAGLVTVYDASGGILANGNF